MSCASSRAKNRPARVTSKAVIFKRGDIVITGILGRVKLAVINRPAIRLPQARRLIGLITFWLFSLIGERGLNRGCPMDTKKTTRRL